MKSLPYLLLLIFTTNIWAQQPDKLPPNQLQQDYNLFKSVLVRAHPNPYRFNDSVTFNQILEKQEKMLQDSMNHIEFFQLVSSMMSLVGEAHSGVDISDPIKARAKDARLFPYRIHFSNKRAFVLEDQSGDPKKLDGFELVSINGKHIDEIIERMDSIACIGTGENRSRIYRMLSFRNNFALSYFLYVDQSPSFLIEYKDQSEGPIKANVVDGKKPDFEIKTLQYPQEVTPPYSLTVDAHRDLAIMKISTFAHFIIGYKVKEYLKFYKSSFEKIASSNISNLVIDVRGNRGGQELLGGYLLAYLLDQPLQLQNFVFTKDLQYKFLDSLKILHHPFSAKNFVPVDSGYILSKHKVLDPIEPQLKNKFRGNVYILADGNCFSACNIFLSLANFHQVGTIIGEESGGNYQDTDGYYGVIFKLPFSGIGIDFRLWHLQTAVETSIKGRGVIPDISIEPTIMDVMNRRDVLMDKVIQLISDDGSQ